MLPYRSQSSIGVGAAEELFEVVLDRLGVHTLFSEDQLLDPVFLFQLLRSCGLVRSNRLAALGIARIIRGDWPSGLRVSTLQPLGQEVPKQFCIVESSDRSPEVGFQEVPPVSDLLGGDAGVGFGLMEPPGKKRVSSGFGLSRMILRRAHIQLDVVKRQIGGGEHSQPFPCVYAIQEHLDPLDVIFGHTRTINDTVDMIGERLALVLELLELDGGDELESLAECGGPGAARRGS